MCQHIISSTNGKTLRFHIIYIYKYRLYVDTYVWEKKNLIYQIKQK